VGPVRAAGAPPGGQLKRHGRAVPAHRQAPDGQRSCPEATTEPSTATARLEQPRPMADTIKFVACAKTRSLPAGGERSERPVAGTSAVPHPGHHQGSAPPTIGAARRVGSISAKVPALADTGQSTSRCPRRSQSRHRRQRPAIHVNPGQGTDWHRGAIGLLRSRATQSSDYQASQGQPSSDGISGRKHAGPRTVHQTKRAY
jgi:hypothetical protein